MPLPSGIRVPTSGTEQGESSMVVYARALEWALLVDWPRCLCELGTQFSYQG